MASNVKDPDYKYYIWHKALKKKYVEVNEYLNDLKYEVKFLKERNKLLEEINDHNRKLK